MKTNLLLPVIAIVLLMTSCQEDITPIEVNAPVTYEFLRNGESTVSFSGQTTRILMATELGNAMVDFDKTAVQLVEMYANQSASGGEVNPYDDTELNESTKSIKSKVAASSDLFAFNMADGMVIRDEIESWIISQANEVSPQSQQLASAGVPGQIADESSARYVSAKGLEYNQAVSKSLIGALLIDQISNNYLSTSVLDASNQVEDNNNAIVDGDNPYTTMEHKWDEAYGYLFGLSEDGASPLMTLGDDNFLNKYLSRVNDDEDFAGIAQEIYDAFKLGRAAIVANEYTVRDEQVEIINEALAKVIGVRAVYYLQSGKSEILAGNLGGAFHDLSEGYGFVYSLSFVKQAGSTQALYSKMEVDALLDQLMIGNGFWDVSAETLDQISESIASRFDFTVSQAF